MYAVVVLSLLAGAAVGCAGDEVPPTCADVAVGELVITEVHGEQGTPWIEIYNASGRPVDLAGTRVVFQKIDGSAKIDTLVRHPLDVAADAYTVLGYVADDMRPSFVDYGFAADWHGAPWPASAAVDVEVCGTRIDRAQYSELPSTGSYSLGVLPPTSIANDLPACWCNDPAAAGTPQQANHACP